MGQHWGYAWNNGFGPVVLVSSESPADAKRQFKATKYARRKTGQRFALCHNAAYPTGFNWEWVETIPPAYV